MVSANPLLKKNDPRILDLLERLKRGLSLRVDARQMGYGGESQLRYALRELVGEKCWLAVMKGRPGSYRSRL